MCHPRTLYRDLEALQVAGFPLYTDQVEGKSLWSVLDTVKHHISVPFSLTELMALYFSKRSIEIVYFTMSRKKESRRRVDPYRVWFFNDTFYLIGHCHTWDEVRIFALDRIMSIFPDIFLCSQPLA